MLGVENINLAYGRDVVVKQVSFAVPKGQFMAILGPNGSGKSTLLRALCRLHKPAEGRILFNGQNLDIYKQQQLARQIACVQQTMSYTFDFTVEEMVMLGRLPYLKRLQTESAQDKVVVEHYLRLTRLWPLRDRYLHALSGGERQRAFLCLALTQQPQLLLLDEPTNHLDIKYQMEMLELLAHLQKEQGLTIIAVLHDLNLAALYADRLLVLEEGSLAADGPPAKVVTAQIVEQVYGCRVSVLEHPLNGRPQILLLPGRPSAP